MTMKKELKKERGYYITDDGRVLYGNKQVKSFINEAGYETVKIGTNLYTVAYLVANHFLNPEKYMLVGFKDGDKLNSNADNLYWYYEGEEETDDYDFYEEKERKPSIPTEVYTVDKDGEIIGEFPTAAAAAKSFGFQRANVFYPQIKEHRFIKKINCFIIKKSDYVKIGKDKLKESVTAKKEHNGNYKKMLKLNLNGVVIKEYKSGVEAANDNNVSYQAILKRCRENDIAIINNDVFIFSCNYSNKTIKERIAMNDEMTEEINNNDGSKIKSKHMNKRKNTPRKKSVLKLNIEGYIIGEYETAKEAVEDNGFVYDTFMGYLYNKGMFISNDMVFMFTDKYNKATITRLIEDYKRKNKNKLK